MSTTREQLRSNCFTLWGLALQLLRYCMVKICYSCCLFSRLIYPFMYVNVFLG